MQCFIYHSIQNFILDIHKKLPCGSVSSCQWSLVSIRLGDIFLILTKYYKNSAQAKRRMSKGRKILNLLLFKSAAIRYIFEKIYKISQNAFLSSTSILLSSKSSYTIRSSLSFPIYIKKHIELLTIKKKFNLLIIFFLENVFGNCYFS